MNFPHLSDTQFPNLPTVNVYQFQNNFDYTRWSEKTQIKLCNVLWNSEYTDVVKFDSDTERDYWFDNIDDYYALELQTAARVVPEGYVKLPIPFDVMARYNYLFIDMPIATSENMPLDYETSDGIKRWYFFIHDIQYLSPNATQVFVLPDIWMNFQNKIDITYMMLERGHAPVPEITVGDYLANPMENNRYLLAPDVNFDNASINRRTMYVPFGNGTKYVCFASTCATGQISQLGEVVASEAYAPNGTITYFDIDARYGHQLGINGLTLGNGRDYSNARTPARTVRSDGVIANNLTVYAIEADEVYGEGATFYQDIHDKCPQFLTTIKACFVVDEECLTLSSNTWNIAGHQFHQCSGHNRSLGEIHLQKSDFGYPQEISRFTKLYTSPYAKLEITDNDGTKFEVNIEETSTLSMESVVSTAFPFLDMRVFFKGIRGSGTSSYTWIDLKGNAPTKYIPKSDWFDFCFDWEIPTFALYMDGETAFMLESFNRNVKQQIQQQKVNYHTTMRSANTAYENAYSQAGVAYTNTEANAATAKANTKRSASTAKSNADRTADATYTSSKNLASTTKGNGDRAADAEKTNAYRTAACQKTNSDNNADLTYTTADRTCTALSDNVNTATAGTVVNETRGIATSNAIYNLNNQLTSTQVNYANDLCQHTTDAEKQKSNATSFMSGVGAVVNGGLQGAYSGAVAAGMFGAAAGTAAEPGGGTAIGALGGAAIGGAVGAVGGSINAFVLQQNTGSTNTASQSVCEAQTEYNWRVNAANMSILRDIQNDTNSLRELVYQKNNEVAVAQQTTSNVASRANATDAKNTAKTNASNTKTMLELNADDTYDAATDNNADSYTVAETNADRTKNTAKTNAQKTKESVDTNADDAYTVAEQCASRTRNNVRDNAGYTRQVAELNAKEILENGKYAAMAGVYDSRNSAPTEICKYDGNPRPDYMQTRGIQIKLKTQSDSAIRQAGDFFARFGYALNQIWDVAESGLKIMRHFTYWKASEIWVNDSRASNNSVNTFIRRIFMNGVTVWNNPEEIGAVNVYTN